MGKLYLCNVFTTAMLDTSYTHTFRFEPISIETAQGLLLHGFEQAVGHPATCAVLSQRLGLDVRLVRANVRLSPSDTLIVAQVVVPRLEEGQVLSQEQVQNLPIIFWLVTEQ